MQKLLILLVGLIPISEIKEEITTNQTELVSAQSMAERADLHYKLASAFFRDQEIDKAFQHFLLALKNTAQKPDPGMNAEQRVVYEAALADYLRGAGSNPARVAKQMLEKYAKCAETNREWLHLNFLLSTAYANLGLYDDFFDRFYRGYCYFGDTFLAYKTRGILYLRLSHNARSIEERCTYQQEAFSCLTQALARNLKDASLYKVLIFLAKDEKNDSLVLNYLQKMCEHEAYISRGDIYLYVREAVALGELALGQRIIDQARTQYDFSRAISAAQDYLNQCRGEHARADPR